MEKRIRFVVGLDLGDRASQICELEARTGEVLQEGRVATTPAGLRRAFSTRAAQTRVALETGTHSGWVARLLEEMGCAVVVANSRRLRMIFENPRKSDRVDAAMLARVARMDRELLHGITPRSQEAHEGLVLLRARHAVVRSRTMLVNAARGLAKGLGFRLPACSTASFARKAWSAVPEAQREAFLGLFASIRMASAAIRRYDQQVERLGEESGETERLRQVTGVGPVTALAFVLVVEPKNFVHARDVGPYLGLVPGRDQSGETDRARPITKTGDGLLRTLLVEAAHYIVGPHGRDCELRRWGLRKLEQVGKAGKKRALVAVARKLAVLLLALRKHKTPYEPLREAGKEVAHEVIA